MYRYVRKVAGVRLNLYKKGIETKKNPLLLKRLYNYRDSSHNALCQAIEWLLFTVLSSAGRGRNI